MIMELDQNSEFRELLEQPNLTSLHYLLSNSLDPNTKLIKCTDKTSMFTETYLHLRNLESQYTEISLLQSATQVRRLDAMKLLISYGADINLSYNKKRLLGLFYRSPLWCAVGQRWLEGIEFLILNGADYTEDGTFSILSKLIIFDVSDIFLPRRGQIFEFIVEVCERMSGDSRSNIRIHKDVYIDIERLLSGIEDYPLPLDATDEERFDYFPVYKAHYTAFIERCIKKRILPMGSDVTLWCIENDLAEIVRIFCGLDIDITSIRKYIIRKYITPSLGEKSEVIRILEEYFNRKCAVATRNMINILFRHETMLPDVIHDKILAFIC